MDDLNSLLYVNENELHWVFLILVILLKLGLLATQGNLQSCKGGQKEGKPNKSLHSCQHCGEKFSYSTVEKSSATELWRKVQLKH